MVIDSSAILAWLKEEPERSRIVPALEAHSARCLSAVSLLEAQIVVRAREHPALLDKLQRFLDEIDVLVTPFDETQARLAADAFQRYGKGQGHPAQLNMGDCAVYALAKSLNGPMSSHVDRLRPGVYLRPKGASATGCFAGRRM
jgi:ribonuclease VapC